MASISRRNFLKVAGLTAGTAALASTIGTVEVAATPKKAKAATTDTLSYDSEDCYAEGYENCVDLCAEGSVLLKNDDSILPLAEGTKVTLLGAMSYNYVEGGTGSAGGMDDEYTVMMNDAFIEAGLDVNSDAWSWLEEQCGGERDVSEADPGVQSSDSEISISGDWTSYQYIHEFDVSVYESGEDVLLADGYTDYAIVTISRSGAEGASPSMDFDGDGSTLTGTTYLELGDNEKDLLSFAAANYAHTILLVNSAASMELGFIDSDEYNIDACLWIGHPGEAGLVGVGTLLTGRNNPSGRLVDTYAYDVTTNPTYYNTDDNRYANANNQTFYQYEEGIYVGYRFYETADAVGYFDSDDFTSHEWKNGAVSGYDQVVQFPFGYGMSYTTFTEEISSSDVALEAHGTNTITVTVTNTGDVAGKDVVELYVDAPYQTDTENFGIKGVGIEKAKVTLCAFGKTSELEAGASEDVELTFQTDDIASYDVFGQGCYVLEAGTYKFNVQSDAHQWGDEGSDNAPTATVSVDLATSYIYDDEGDVADAEYVGARDSDAEVARNCMDDVTAGDGNMLDGYLSRADIAGGMATIMEHTSDEEANENLRDEAEAALALSGTETLEYEYETYIKGEKTTLTETLYAKGANMMPFATALPDGTDVSGLDFPEWEQVYYVIEDSYDDNGVPEIVDEEPTDGSSYHTLTYEDLSDVDITTDSGLEAWDKLINMATLDDAIEVQGNTGGGAPEVPSLGIAAQPAADGPGEPNNGNFAGATWFPCAITIAATWNTDLARTEGEVYGRQALLAGLCASFAPAMNTHRSPFGGRNFEYYSEDGFLAGKIGGNAIAGIQSTGDNVFCKHCALNDGDTNRNGNCTWASEQAVREIYMRPWEISIKEYGANGVMGSLNRIGLSWWHYGMYVTMMRKEWGWYGYLITDGDGADGDVYNNPQALLASESAILNDNVYIDAASTVAAFGDATQYAYGQQCLHNVLRYEVYQVCGPRLESESSSTASTDSSTVSSTDSSSESSTDSSTESSTDSSSESSSDDSGVSTGAIVGGVVVAAAVVAAVAYGVHRHNKNKDEDDDEEDEDEEEEEETTESSEK